MVGAPKLAFREHSPMIVERSKYCSGDLGSQWSRWHWSSILTLVPYCIGCCVSAFAWATIPPLRLGGSEIVPMQPSDFGEMPRRTREILQESEERFRLLVEGVKDYVIFMLDADGYVTTWNAGAQRIKGYTADEIIGQHFSAFYPEVDI